MIGTPVLDPDSAFAARAMAAQRASRAAIRRAAGTRLAMTAAGPRLTATGAGVRPAGIAAGAAPALTSVSRRPSVTTSDLRTSATTGRTHLSHRSVQVRHTRAVIRRAVARTRTVRHTATSRGQHEQVVRLGNMTAVIAYAKSQVGARYVSGGEGGSGFDCSGLTKQAYAKAGIRLPHNSGAQAARAHRISRGQARAGDLVVGRGHVGIYMGNGMMIDAGNHRTGVVYRKLYSGLTVERIR